MKTKILMLTLLPVLGLAEVNMQDASYQRTESETTTRILDRTYNSQSLWFGAFGFGWCADFERKLDVGKQMIDHCGKKISVHLQRIGAQLVTKDLNDQNYFYNFRGQLMQIMDSSGSLWVMSYDSQGRLSRIQKGWQVFFLTWQGSRISQLKSAKGELWKYLYDRQFLIQSQSSSLKTTYRYDQNHNLIEWSTHPGITETIDYSVDQDQVQRVHRGPCIQEFTFEKKSDFQVQSRVQTRCPSSVSRVRIFTFQVDPSGDWKVKTSSTSGGSHETVP